jgi:hypothetical protein
MAYAAVTDVAARSRPLADDETTKCEQLLDDAAVIIDAYQGTATADAKKLVSCNMVIRAMGLSGAGDNAAFPTGATQGSVSALGYSQSWTIAGGGSTGELYITKTEKRILGVGNRIGSRSPTEGLVADD